MTPQKTKLSDYPAHANQYAEYLRCLEYGYANPSEAREKAIQEESESALQRIEELRGALQAMWDTLNKALAAIRYLGEKCIIVDRNEEYIQSLKAELEKFNKKVIANKEILQSKGYL